MLEEADEGQQEDIDVTHFMWEVFGKPEEQSPLPEVTRADSESALPQRIIRAYELEVQRVLIGGGVPGCFGMQPNERTTAYGALMGYKKVGEPLPGFLELARKKAREGARQLIKCAGCSLFSKCRVLTQGVLSG